MKKMFRFLRDGGSLASLVVLMYTLITILKYGSITWSEPNLLVLALEVFIYFIIMVLVVYSLFEGFLEKGVGK